MSNNMNFNLINNVNEPLHSKPKERRIFRVEKVSRSDLMRMYDKLFTHAEDGIIADDIITTNNQISNHNLHEHNNSEDNNFNFNNHSNNEIKQAKYICHFPDCYKEYKSKYKNQCLKTRAAVRAIL